MKHLGRRTRLFWKYNKITVVVFMYLLKNKIEYKRWMFVHRSDVPLRYTALLPHHIQTKTSHPTKEILVTPLLTHRYTNTFRFCIFVYCVFKWISFTVHSQSVGKTGGGSGRRGKRQPGIVLASKGHGNVTCYLSNDFFPKLLMHRFSYVNLLAQDNGRQERRALFACQRTDW